MRGGRSALLVAMPRVAVACEFRKFRSDLRILSTTMKWQIVHRSGQLPHFSPVLLGALLDRLPVLQPTAQRLRYWSHRYPIIKILNSYIRRWAFDSIY